MFLNKKSNKLNGMNKILYWFRQLKVLFVLQVVGCGIITDKHAADQHFSDPQVIALAEASVEGDILEIDRLLKAGVDINTVGKAGLNPIYWLLVHNKESEKKKIGFHYFLKNDANVLQAYTPTNEPLLHVTAEYIDSIYLKMILEEQPDVDIDFETESSWNTALLQAESSNRFQNFKILLDHGADIEKKMEEEILH